MSYCRPHSAYSWLRLIKISPLSFFFVIKVDCSRHCAIVFKYYQQWRGDTSGQGERKWMMRIITKRGATLLASRVARDVFTDCLWTTLPFVTEVPTAQHLAQVFSLLSRMALLRSARPHLCFFKICRVLLLLLWKKNKINSSAKEWLSWPYFPFALISILRRLLSRQREGGKRRPSPPTVFFFFFSFSPQ